MLQTVVGVACRTLRLTVIKHGAFQILKIVICDSFALFKFPATTLFVLKNVVFKNNPACLKKTVQDDDDDDDENSPADTMAVQTLWYHVYNQNLVKWKGAPRTEC